MKMEDFDVFTNEINFTNPLYTNILNKFVKDTPVTPNASNYHSSRKLIAEEYLSNQDEMACAFHLSESVSAFVRTMAVYRDEQITSAADKYHKVKSYVMPVKDIITNSTSSKNDETLLDFLSDEMKEISSVLKTFENEEKVPFHKRYLKFSSENNTENFKRILNELPKEWTIIQLTAPYNPNENLKPFNEYKKEIHSIYLSVFNNDYLEDCKLGPITLNIPANVIKEGGERPLFEELYSLLEDNYNTINNAQVLNNKRLLKNYWDRREDVDLRLKSALHVMGTEWLGGYCCLLTGKLVDADLKDKVKQLVDNTITDWGFIKLTNKQKFLLYNLIESSRLLSTQQIKSTIRKILSEHGNPDDVRQVFDSSCHCQNCSKEFRFLNELCLKCLSECFKAVHHFSLMDGVKAFTETATLVKDNDKWNLKTAKRHPVILIVDEMLDTFPWETLAVLNNQPVSRIENIHFLYYLYKIHEKHITDGYFNAKSDIGRYIINPEKNLDRMEKRMSSFVQYWCSGWNGHIGEPPPPEEFLRYLTESDVFLYCGHGDGCHFANGSANGAGVEGATGTVSVAVLSGCGSVRLQPPPGRGPPGASHHHLHVAGCPMAIGMLWEVTDLEVDKVVTTLVSLYVPSSAALPWPSVGKAKWSRGVLDTNVEQRQEVEPERDLLRAVSRARASSDFVMISSSMVARGLPIRITGD